MDGKYLKILQELKDAGGVGVYHNISPLLLTFYKDVDKMNRHSVSEASGQIHRLLEGMKEDGLIQVQSFISLGSGNETNGYTWLDVVHINATIKQTGLTALDNEINKGAELRLHESMIETNSSVQATNKATQRLYDNVLPENFTAQEKANKWSLRLAGLSVLFIALTAYLQWTDKTPHRLQELKQEVQETAKNLKELRSSLKDVNSSIQNKSETIYVKYPSKIKK